MATNDFLREWNNLKENKGTINKCLVDFQNTINLSKETEFTKFCKALFAKYDSNKALNKAYYDKIKDTFKIGSIVSYKQNDNTIVQYERRCSEWDIFQYFYKLYKESK